MLQEKEIEGYQETVLMVESVTTWSAGLVHSARTKMKDNVMFVFKERHVRLGCCKHKGCPKMSGFGL